MRLVDREEVDRRGPTTALAEARVGEALGRDVQAAGTIPSATAASVAAASAWPSDESSRKADSCPRARSASTWSRISACSGETTIVSSSVARPGIA